MNTFRESDLEIAFPDDWIVRKFDATAAFRSISGQGLKGVDFLCLAPRRELWLVEIKNFRPRAAHRTEARRHPRDLAQHVGAKFADSKRLIHIMNRALRTKWWSGPLRFWYRIVRVERPRSHYWFWLEAARRLEEPGRVVCVLWLETPERAPDYASATAAALSDLVDARHSLHLAESQGRPEIPIKVRPNPSML